MLFVFDFKGFKRHSPLSLKKRGGISMNLFYNFPLSNSVREGELKGVSQKKVHYCPKKILKE
jgi:hypothetical protein